MTFNFLTADFFANLFLFGDSMSDYLLYHSTDKSV